MKIHLYKMIFILSVFTLIFLVSFQTSTAQRRNGRPVTRQRNVAGTNTNLNQDQALRIAAILEQTMASIQLPTEGQLSREQLSDLARTQIMDILNVLTPEQKRQIGYGIQIVDPESSIDFVAKIPCINPDFVNALRQEIRYLLRGDPQSVQRAAAVLHPNGNPYEYITVLKQPCTKSSSTPDEPVGETQFIDIAGVKCKMFYAPSIGIGGRAGMGGINFDFHWGTLHAGPGATPNPYQGSALLYDAAGNIVHATDHVGLNFEYYSEGGSYTIQVYQKYQVKVENVNTVNRYGLPHIVSMTVSLWDQDPSTGEFSYFTPNNISPTATIHIVIPAHRILHITDEF